MMSDMTPNPERRLHYIEGEITAARVENGRLYLHIDGEEVRITQPKMADRFHEGEYVRLLLRQAGPGASFKVLAWQRPGQRRVHYTGIRPTVGFMLVGLVLLLTGVFTHSGPLIGSGLALMVLQTCFVVWKAWTFHLFHMPGHWRTLPNIRAAAAEPSSASPPVILPEPTVPTAPSVPLELHAFPPPARAAEARNWPAEILEFTHDAIIIWEMGSAGILYWNRAAEQLYGYSREEARGRVTHELLKTQIAGGVSELETRIARYGLWIGTLRHTRKDGQRVEAEGRLTLMPQEGRPWLVLEVNRDVTDRNAAELARRQMEMQLAKHVATLSDE